MDCSSSARPETDPAATYIVIINEAGNVVSVLHISLLS